MTRQDLVAALRVAQATRDRVRADVLTALAEEARLVQQLQDVRRVLEERLADKATPIGVLETLYVRRDQLAARLERLRAALPMARRTLRTADEAVSELLQGAVDA